CRRRCSGEMKQARLCPGIRIDTKRGVILPGDVQSPRHLQNGRGTVRFACFTTRLISGRVPGGCDFAAFWVERDLHVIVLVRHEHPVAPLLGDLRHPVAGVIVWRGRARGSWSSALGIAWTLRSE